MKTTRTTKKAPWRISLNLSGSLRFDSAGLIPAIVQDDRNDAVLMMAYMNQTALKKTLTTGRVHFWSRSRKKLWRKGDTSGNRMRVCSVQMDCDRDTLLVRVQAAGPACHTGKPSCFFTDLPLKSSSLKTPSPSRSLVLDRIFDVILDRKKSPQKKSYVTHLLKSGRDAILKKIGEESSELIIGSKNNRRAEIIWETADLWFHSLVLMGYHGIPPADIYRELESRFGKTSKAFTRKKS